VRAFVRACVHECVCVCVFVCDLRTTKYFSDISSFLYLRSTDDLTKQQTSSNSVCYHYRQCML